MENTIETKKTFGKGAAYVLIILVLVAGLGGVMLLKNHQKENRANIILDAYATIPTQTGKNLYYAQSAGLTKQVDPELVDLDSQAITCSPDISKLSGDNPSVGGSCIGPGATFNVPTDQLTLGGQCCGALLDTKKYHEQLEGLKKYSYIPNIPPNPYKTPIELAKRLIDYDKNTKLSAEQQKIYDAAMALSEEGPCCCKCWHWYVNEGLAKKLIIEYKFTPKQIAEVWDLSDICGK